MDSEERRKIVELLKRGNLSHRAIARQFNRSQSTISAIAKEEGITPTHRRRRSSAVESVEETYSKEKRIATADKVLASLDNLISSVGLTPREFREVSQAFKQTLEARRAEDQLVDGALAGAEPGNLAYKAPGYALELVALNKDGIPKNAEIYFSTLDVEIARDRGDDAEAKEIEERVRQACLKAGVAPGDIDIDKMLAKIDEDFNDLLRREEELKQRQQAALKKRAEAEYNGQGLA